MPTTTATNGGKKKRRTDSRFVLFRHRILVVGKMYLCVPLENRPPSSPTSASNSESPIPQPPFRTPRFPADFPQGPPPTVCFASAQARPDAESMALLFLFSVCFNVQRAAGRGTHSIVFIFKVTSESHSSLDAFGKPISNKCFTTTWNQCKHPNTKGPPPLEP